MAQATGKPRPTTQRPNSRTAEMSQVDGSNDNVRIINEKEFWQPTAKVNLKQITNIFIQPTIKYSSFYDRQLNLKSELRS